MENANNTQYGLNPIKTIKTVLIEQAALLANWNKENLDKEPEQARKNIETILAVYGSGLI